MAVGVSNTTVEVTIVLGRRLVNSIMTVYMPTILLNIIGHSTNFFKPESFDAGAAVNLMVEFGKFTFFISFSITGDVNVDNSIPWCESKLTQDKQHQND